MTKTMSHKRTRSWPALLALAALGCFSERTTQPSDSDSPCDGSVTPCAVEMRDNIFIPATLRVTAGSSVRWTNAGATSHTSTSTSWDSGTMTPGQTFQRAFPDAGSFDYECIFHAGMDGTIVVE